MSSINQGLRFSCYLSRAMSEMLNGYSNTKLSQESHLIISDILKKDSCTIIAIEKAFKDNNLRMDIVSTTSNYDGNITTKNGIEIILEDYKFQIPNNIYETIKFSANSKTEKVPPILKFGYLMRSIDGNRASITAGSYNYSNCEVAFDIFTYELLDPRALALKLVHELLHHFGYDEQTVLNMQMNIFLKNQDLLVEYAQIIYNSLSSVKSVFLGRVEVSANTCINEFTQLLKIAEIYYQNGFPIPPTEIATTKLIHPIDTKKNIEVLFF
jgi:hypothetical protein